MKRSKNVIDYSNWTEAQHAEHLRTHEPYQEYFKKYKPESVENFISTYANRKYEMFNEKRKYEDKYDAHQTEFLTKAAEYIDMILQKKLGNLQCQWRAGLIELPLVKITNDFDYWEKNIRQCPFIAPVTEEELDLCVRFLDESYDWTDNRWQETNWQNYTGFKNQRIIDDNEDRDPLLPEIELPSYGEELPDLYEFFDTYQNTNTLLILPDLRKQKEEKYMNAGYEIDNKKWEEKQIAEGKLITPTQNVDENEEVTPKIYLPSLYNFEYLTFIEEMEDEQTKELQMKQAFYERVVYNNYDNDEIDHYFNFLKKFDEPIPIRAHDNWEIALELAVRDFKQKKTAEILPYAYDAYLLEFDDADTVEALVANKIARFKYNEASEGYKIMMKDRKIFLYGRKELAGVEDFDYL